MSIKVFIVDDHAIFRKGLKALLDELPIAEFAGEASNGKEFLEKIQRKPPEIVLMDVKMPVMDGLEATLRALETHPDLKIITLSMFDDQEYLEEMIQAGAVGYMLKNISKEHLEKAIEKITAGGSYFCENMIMVATKKVTKNKQDAEKQQIIDSLSKRELEILELICKGFSTKQISEKLSISPRTVDGHRNNMINKTGFNNTPALVSFAINNNLVNC